MFGADDFLPCLTWVLLRSDVVTLQQDTDYMMELLDPTQLQGEGETDLITGSFQFAFNMLFIVMQSKRFYIKFHKNNIKYLPGKMLPNTASTRRFLLFLN